MNRPQRKHNCPFKNRIILVTVQPYASLSRNDINLHYGAFVCNYWSGAGVLSSTVAN